MVTFGKGAIRDNEDKRDFVFQPRLGAIQLPSSYSTFDSVPLKIKNQYTSSSCVGQGIAYYLETLNYLKSGIYKELSAKSIYSQIYLPGGGAQIRDGIALGVNYGINLESTVPSSYNNSAQELFMEERSWMSAVDTAEAKTEEATTYNSISPDGTIDLVKRAIFENKGVNTGFIMSNEGWQTGDVRPPLPGEEQDGHDQFLTGWTADGKIESANSWSDQWGYKGRAHIPTSYFTPQWCFSLWTYVMNNQTYMLQTVQPIGDNRVYAVINGNYYWITSDRMYNEGLNKIFAPFVQVPSVDSTKVIGTFNKEY